MDMCRSELDVTFWQIFEQTDKKTKQNNLRFYLILLRSNMQLTISKFNIKENLILLFTYRMII